MTRNEQLVFCKKCTNRKMNPKVGLICSLTGEKATFNGECPDYNLDETKKGYSGVEDMELAPEEIKARLSMEDLEELRLEQNLPMGLIAGIITGLVGSLVWSGISIATLYQINYLAIGIGVAVGISIRYFGKGLDKIFGVSGALIALSSIVLGNVLTIIGLIGNEQNLSFFQVLLLMDFSYIPELLMETFDPRDLIFYGFALAMGYKFSFRQFSTNELDEYRRKKIQSS
ncbi:hypothetical protein HHU12_25155 [Flammeovirga aprica JL-4]|uniref:Uncharacterized protein n=2 Tax=Flammeovirga aprica TaxID=29528 RepID=A0A7X9XC16_9BACT|nr:hypothetical protein [Flammeovirga aprica JL-4]